MHEETVIVAPGASLAECEAVIECGREAAFAAGEALRRISDGRLYRDAGFKTMEDYLAERWGFTRSYAYRLMDAADVAELLSPMGDKPQSERVARELAPVLHEDPERVPEVWGEIVEEHGPTPTAAQVRETVRESSNNTKPSTQTPRRKPLPDLIEAATFTLHQTVHALEGLTRDDRFPTYRNEVAPLVRNHLVNTIQTCQKILDQLPHQPPEGTDA